MDRAELLRQLELYRPEIDPESPAAEGLRRALEESAELRDHHRAIRSADRRIGESLRKPVVPPSLASSVRHALAEDRPARRSRWRLTRRRFAAMTVAVAASLAVVGWLLRPAPTDEWEFMDVANEAVRMFQDISDLKDDGGGVELPAGFDPRFFRGEGVVEFLGVRARAFRFERQGRSALVIVAPRSAEFGALHLPKAYPNFADGLSVDCFVRDGSLVVTVFHGNLDALDRFRRQDDYS